MRVLNKVLSRRTLFLSEFVIFANPCLEEADENVKRFMCKLNEMSTKKLSIKELLQSGDCDKEVEISGWAKTQMCMVSQKFQTMFFRLYRIFFRIGFP